MNRTALALLVAAAVPASVLADEAIKESMKKYHKPEDAICKKVGKGEATDADLATLLSSYEEIAKATPPKGDKSSWETKTGALIAAIKKVQAKDASGVSEFKKAINCKACHDVHKGK